MSVKDPVEDWDPNEDLSKLTQVQQIRWNIIKIKKNQELKDVKYNHESVPKDIKTVLKRSNSPNG